MEQRKVEEERQVIRDMMGMWVTSQQRYESI